MPVHLQRRVAGQAGVGERVQPTLAARHRGGERGDVVRGAADVPDPAVTETDQVRSGLPAGGQVVEPDGDLPRHAGADEDHRVPEADQGVHLGPVQRQAHDEDAVHPPAEHVGVHPAPGGAPGDLEGVQQRAEAFRLQGPFGALDHVREEPVLDPGGQQPDRHGPPGGERGGRRRRHVAELGRDHPDPRAGAGRDVGEPPQCAGDGRRRHSGDPGDLVDAMRHGR